LEFRDRRKVSLRNGDAIGAPHGAADCAGAGSTWSILSPNVVHHFTALHQIFLQMKIKMVWRNFFPQSSKSCDEVFHIVDTVFEGHRLASWYQ
jgi:hypothetical protein